MGRLIPAGTGMPYYQRVEIPEEVYETREETFDQDYKPNFAAADEATSSNHYWPGCRAEQRYGRVRARVRQRQEQTSDGSGWP